MRDEYLSIEHLEKAFGHDAIWCEVSPFVLDIGVDERDYRAYILIGVVFVVDFAEVEGEAYELLGFYGDLVGSCSNFLEVLVDLDEDMEFYLLSEYIDNLKENILSLGLDLPLLFYALHKLDSDLFVHGLEEGCELYFC